MGRDTISKLEYEQPLRITVVRPPAGVQFCVQSGRAELLGATISSGKDISFEVKVRVRVKDRAISLLGPVTQGPPSARFLYICSGTLAGQADSRWTRRAKVPLTGITKTLIESARKKAAKLEAHINGTGKDGGPACASVPLLDDGWGIIRD